MKEDIRRQKNHWLFKNLSTLIIDEISMVRVEMMDNIDYFLRINRGVNQPFGGVQMIFFGDLFQLPPVIASIVERQYLESRYESPYFFSAQVFSEVQFEMIELNNVYRQEERNFINLLDNIRTNDFDYYDLEELNERCEPIPDDYEFMITLSSRNSIVNEINRRRISEILNPELMYLAQVTGDFSPKVFPTELALKLKENAQVMFVKNDPEKRFVNGTIGKISSLSEEQINVDILTREGTIQTIDVPKLTWEIIKYNVENGKVKSDVIGTFTQYPLKLAWAITIHKSQGKTFDNIIIDIGRGAFEYGQTYVALSRCRTLNGIYLKRPITRNDILVDEKILDFYSLKKRLS